MCHFKRVEWIFVHLRQVIELTGVRGATVENEWIFHMSAIPAKLVRPRPSKTYVG